MINQVLVDELVSDIQAGKKDLRECIEDYERQLDEEDGTFAVQLREQEESYESDISYLEGENSELEYKASELEDKIDDLNLLIEELRVTISNQEKEIDKLENKIDDLKDEIRHLNESK